MSSDWVQCRLGDVITLKRGYDLPKQSREQGTVPIVSSSGVSDYHNVAMAKAPGVVTGRYGTIGNIYYVKEDYFPLNTTLYVKDFKGNDPGFISYHLRTIDFNSCSDKAAVPGVNRNHLHELQTAIPPIAEQKAIAHILGTLDDKIELNRKTNETLEAMAKALFKSWFVDFDPVRAKAEGRSTGLPAQISDLFPDSFEDSELGEIPSGWSIGTIGNSVGEVFDGPHATPKEASDGYVFLGIKNMTGTSLDLSDKRWIGVDDWKKWTRRVMPSSGDIVFTYEAALGLFAVIPFGLSCCLGRRMALIRPRTSDATPYFWFHQFVAESFQRLIEERSIHGATVNRTPLTEFPQYPVLSVPVEIRNMFESTASALWSRIHLASNEIESLASLRDALLPKLISGEIRIRDAEKILDEVGI
jgi:type I restriction enzyme S subunit